VREAPPFDYHQQFPEVGYTQWIVIVKTSMQRADLLLAEVLVVVLKQE